MFVQFLIQLTGYWFFDLLNSCTVFHYKFGPMGKDRSQGFLNLDNSLVPHLNDIVDIMDAVWACYGGGGGGAVTSPPLPSLVYIPY